MQSLRRMFLKGTALVVISGIVAGLPGGCAQNQNSHLSDGGADFVTVPTPTTSPAPALAAFNVRDFGARGDGSTKDTAAIQKALDTCAVSGGGEVLVPAGNYLIGSIEIGTHSTLVLEQNAVLGGSPDIADYPYADVRWEGRWQIGHRGLIYAADVDDIGITGPGRIAGSTAFPGTNQPDTTRSPVVIEMMNCNHITWDGITITQGANWAVHPVYCTDVHIDGVSISGGRDGIDVDSCKGVAIDHCTINTGDDAISLKSGRGMDGARIGKPCEDVTITNCNLTCTAFACLGIGSEISGGVKNVRIEHCTLNSPRSQAIYIKTRIGRAGTTENISGDDLDVQAQTFLRINLVSGGNTSTADDPVEGLLGYPVARNIAFTNIRVNLSRQLVRADEISAKQPLEGLILRNITGTAAAGITLANTEKAEIAGVKISGVSGRHWES